MKRFILFLALSLFLSSCSPTQYMQLVTLRSDNVSIVDNSFIYKDDYIAIDYLFSTKDGVFEFAVLNLTDGDIFVDIEKSLFVYNRKVYDYAGIETSVTAYNDRTVSSSHFYGYGVVSSSSESSGVATTVSKSMPSVILIPKGCYRTFSGFDINNSVYRQLYFARDPKPDEDVRISGDEINQPLSFSNIIYIRTPDKEYSVENNFEVEEIRNVYVQSPYDYSVNPNYESITILPSMYCISYTGSDIGDIYDYYYFDDRSEESSDLEKEKDNTKYIR